MSTLKEQALKAFEEEVVHTRSHSDERDANGLYLQPGLQKSWRDFYAGYQSASESAPWLSQIAKSKIDQMGGTVCGVLVRNEAGALAAVSDMGRVTWLGEPEIGPVEYSGAEIESIKQRAEAWLGLTELLDELAPEWRELPGTGRESAFSAIRSLNQAAQAPKPIIPNSGYTVERHGNGYAIYRGRTMEHHGENLGHLTECLPHLPDMIEKALNTTAQAPASGEVEVVERENGRKRELQIRRAKIEKGVYKAVREDGEVFLIHKGIRCKGWTIENQRTFQIDSAVDLGHAEYTIRNCFGRVCQEVRQK